MGAWVTPNSPAIEQFLTAAKARAPQQSFGGRYSASLPQVKAMFDELKSTGVTYVSDPTIFSQFDRVQRTRLPKQVLASRSAQCLEGSLTFASLMESIGLEPFIVLVPGHVFVGWEPTEKDYRSSRSPFFLETTMVGSNSFEEALATADVEVRRNQPFGDSKDGKAFALKISDLRKEGVTPQPYQ
jgi:hypothetical protein